MKVTTEVAMQQSAVVLTHQQFDRPKVEQPARRGRLPKGVVAMASPREVEVTPEPMPDNPIDAARRALATMQASMDFALAKIAEYEKCHRRTG